jgi:hypothetical protein
MTKRQFAADAPIKTPSYRGPDRRMPSGHSEVAISKEVTFDAKGNPVLDIRSTTPRRREDDDTLDLIKCLDESTLSILED